MSSILKSAMSRLGLIEDQEIEHEIYDEEDNEESEMIDFKNSSLEPEVEVEFEDTKSAVLDIKKKLQTIPRKKNNFSSSYQESALNRLGFSLIEPKTFDDAKILADKFATQKPIVMDLNFVSELMAKRLLDFSSGVCYVLDGKMEKVSSRIFILRPASIRISDKKLQDIRRILRV